VRRRRGQPLPGRTRLARWLAGGASGFGVLFTISFGYLLLMAGNLGAGISREGLLVAALTCGLISAALSLGALGGLVVVWGKESGLRFGGRLYYSLVTLAALAFGWFLWTWNLLGYRM
jgi:hypothetical protein